MSYCAFSSFFSLFFGIFIKLMWNILFRMDIDYSPTGREFVTGSYDRTVSFIQQWLVHLQLYSTKKQFLFSLTRTLNFSQIRIFQYNGGHSREIYHTKRMQRFIAILFISLEINSCYSVDLAFFKAPECYNHVFPFFVGYFAWSSPAMVLTLFQGVMILTLGYGKLKPRNNWEW